MFGDLEGEDRSYPDIDMRWRLHFLSQEVALSLSRPA